MKYCRICEQPIRKGQITKRVKTNIEHEDFIQVHKRCYLDEVGRVTTPEGKVYPRHQEHILHLYNKSSTRNIKALERMGMITPQEKKSIFSRWFAPNKGKDDNNG